MKIEDFSQNKNFSISAHVIVTVCNQGVSWRFQPNNVVVLVQFGSCQIDVVLD